MPKISGLDLVRHVRENHKDMEIIMITGYPSVGGAVQAVKSGAEEYLAKPFTDVELLAAVRRALDKLSQRRLGGAASPRSPARPAWPDRRVGADAQGAEGRSARWRRARPPC